MGVVEIQELAPDERDLLERPLSAPVTHFLGVREGAWVVCLLLSGSGCRTVNLGLDERLSAIVRDYRTRVPSRFSSAAEPVPRQVGQYTVHLVARASEVQLERLAVVRRAGDRWWLSLEILGTTTWSARVLVDGERVVEAWVKNGERPEVHHRERVPDEVTVRITSAFARGEGPSGEVVVGAGRFEGCVDGTHPVVPLSGVVQSRGPIGQRELLEFGDDGSGALF